MSPRKLLYIMSPSYSGSTLLTRLLACHPELATVGELKATSLGDIEAYRCSCGDKLLECPFWNAVKADVEAQGGRMDLREWRTRFETGSALVNRIMMPLVRGPGFEAMRSLAFSIVPGARASLDEILLHNAQVIEAVCRLQQGSVFLDESKDPLRLKYFLQSGRWDIYVVRLIRDGRGTVNSDRRHNGLAVRESAANWCRKVEEMDRVAALMPASHLMDVAYEDLCNETERTLGAIAEFVGVDGAPGAFDDRPEQHIIGNDMRLGALSEVVLDEKWRTAMSTDDLAEFAAVAGSLNQRLGYGG